MFKEVGKAEGIAKRAEERINRASLGSAISVWGRKAVLVGMIITSAIVADKAYSAVSNTNAQSTAAVSVKQKTATCQQLVKMISSFTEMGIKLRENGIRMKFQDGSVWNTSYEELGKAAEQLENSGVRGIMNIYITELPRGGSRHLNDEIGRESIVLLRAEKKDIVKIIELARTQLTYEDAKKIFLRGKCENPIFFEYSKDYPKGCKDYIENLGRECYKTPFLGFMFPGNIHRMNTEISAEIKGKLQALATAIIRAEYSDKKVTPEGAVISINKWISNNILFAGMGEYALRSYKTATGAIWYGCGVCTDMANLLDVMCNSIGVPARMVFIGKKSFWRDKIVGGGFHCVTEVYLEGKGWVIFDPLNRIYNADEHYTRETYFRLLPLLEQREAGDIIFNPSRPIKR
jgi:transglutaminase-like putative cysteine protease